MKDYEVGDKILIQAEIKAIDSTSFYPYHVSIDGAQAWVREEDIFEDSVKSYEDGMNDAWEAARKIASSETDGGYSSGELCEIFGEEGALGVSKILRKLTATEATAKIADWEDSKKIHVGDVVKTITSEGVVTCVMGDWLNVLQKDGKSINILMYATAKTGRKVDVEGFLRQIGGTE